MIKAPIREEFAKLEVEANEGKSSRVDLTQGERFGFLSFEFRRVRSRSGRWMPLYRPRTKKRTALLRKQAVFRRLRSQSIARVIEEINPILRVWANLNKDQFLNRMIQNHRHYSPVVIFISNRKPPSPIDQLWFDASKRVRTRLL